MFVPQSKAIRKLFRVKGSVERELCGTWLRYLTDSDQPQAALTQGGFDVWFMVAIRTHKLIMQTRWKNTHCTLDIIIISIIRDESRTET